MHRLMVSLLMVMTFFAGHAKTTFISGELPGAGGRIIRVSRMCSLVSHWTTPLAETTIGKKGEFNLQLDIAQTCCAILSVDCHQAELFLEPGATYEISILALNERNEKDINPFSHTQSLEISFLNSDPAELNHAIIAFNELYDGFVLEHFNQIYQERNRSLLDTFRLRIANKFTAVSDPFFKEYCKYKLASIEQAAMSGSHTQLARKYFYKQAVLYNNPEYMEFFQSVFKKYLTATSRDLRSTDYKVILSGTDPYTGLMKVLGRDTLLVDIQFRELLMIFSLLEFSNTKDYPHQDILRTLLLIQQQTKFPDNKLLAWDLTQFLTWLKPGTPAMDFKLTDLDGKQVSLSQFKGKPILLWFWTTNCNGCLNDMERLLPLTERFRDEITFLAVSADKSFLTMQYFLKQKQNFPWKFLHIGTSVEVLINYNVRSYPLYVLIDKQGNIFSYEAEMPGDGFEASMKKVLEN